MPYRGSFPTCLFNPPPEQFVLELINRANFDPEAEALRHNAFLNGDVPAAHTISSTAKQPLAMNDVLLDAARAHSQDMIDGDYFDHDSPAGKGPSERMIEAGYPLVHGAENISWTASNVPLSGKAGEVNQLYALQFIGAQFTGAMFELINRVNIFAEDFKESGTGVVGGSGWTFAGGDNTEVLMLTQDFATRGQGRIITGVVYDDSILNNDFYTIGEGRQGVNVTVGKATATSGVAGGYALNVGSGACAVTFAGGDLATAMTVAVGGGTANIKLDIVEARQFIVPRA